MTVSPPSLLLVDDDPAMRRRIGALLREGIVGAVVGEADSAASCLERLGERPWDLVLLDISMPGTRGLELLTTLVATSPDRSIVMLSGLPRDPYEAATRRAGARAYVAKQRAAEDLVPTILAVLAAAPPPRRSP